MLHPSKGIIPSLIMTLDKIFQLDAITRDEMTMKMWYQQIELICIF